jgi:drug/metabolite transporter (DMT)-like permease
MICGLATVQFGWATLDNSVFALLALAVAIGHIAANEAVRRSDISVLGPFDYSAIVWALAVDVMIFGFEPRHLGLLGILVIVLAALSLALKQVRSAT